MLLSMPPTAALTWQYEGYGEGLSMLLNMPLIAALDRLYETDLVCGQGHVR